MFTDLNQATIDKHQQENQQQEEDDVAAICDIKLKYDNRLRILRIHIDKLFIVQYYRSRNVIKNVAVQVKLLPDNKSLMTHPAKYGNIDGLYIHINENLKFRHMKMTQIGYKGLEIGLIEISTTSCITLGHMVTSANQYLPMDQLDLTENVSCILVNLTTNRVDYNQQNIEQNQRLIHRQVNPPQHISSADHNYPTTEPYLSLDMVFHENSSTLQICILRARQFNYSVVKARFRVSYFLHKYQVVSSSTSPTAIKFSDDDLIYESITLDTFSTNIKDGGVLVELIPVRRRHIRSNAYKAKPYKSNQSLMFLVFGSNHYSSLSCKIAWMRLLNRLQDAVNDFCLLTLPENTDTPVKWHLLRFGDFNQIQ